MTFFAGLTLQKILGYIFFILIVVWKIGIIKRNKGELWDAIRGEDRKLQVQEIAILIWVIVFPILVLSELFLGLTVSSSVWYSMNGIFVALILGDLGTKYLGNKNNNNKEE